MSGRDQLRNLLEARATMDQPKNGTRLQQQVDLKQWLSENADTLCAALAKKLGDSTVRRVYLSELRQDVPGFGVKDFVQLDTLRRWFYSFYNGRVRVEGDQNTIGYFFVIV